MSVSEIDGDDKGSVKELGNEGIKKADYELRKEWDEPISYIQDGIPHEELAKTRNTLANMMGEN